LWGENTLHNEGLLKVRFFLLGVHFVHFGMGGDKHLFVLCGVKVHYEGAVLSMKMYFFWGTFCIILGNFFKKIHLAFG
jgi:hypothetical protein